MTEAIARPGTVYLVGAGPGDPGLLTLRARELLRECDVIVHDALVNQRIFSSEFLSRDRPAEMHDVGKRGGIGGGGILSARQPDIEALLIRLAREGKRVVRLKGGDPFVFGRGSEEALSLSAASVPFEIVPGVTAGVAASAYAGIPVTHRGIATSVTFVTGHEDPDKQEAETDWQALARVGGTLVLYMGVRRLPEIVAALLSGGMDPSTPLAMIEWGTYPRQRVVGATLETAVEHARAAGVVAPSVTIVGDVVRLREEIAWFERRALSGKRIVVTRARAQASELVSRLTELGADVLEAPVIRIEPLLSDDLQAAVARLDTYGWIIFTSRNAVDVVWRAVKAAGRDARVFALAKLCAVGPATADALAGVGLAADLVPERFVAEGIVEAMAGRDDVRGARVLFARALEARDVVVKGLASLGAVVDDVAVYRTVQDDESAAALCDWLDRDRVDLVTFTSASTVRNFVAAVGAARSRSARAASIGPVTTSAARAAGIDVATEADSATIPDLVAAIVQLCGSAQ